jgi:hypothetical protein
MRRFGRDRLVMLVAAAPAVRAQTQNGCTPGEWMMRYTGARTLGLGGAYVALADDPLGVLWNPAGLSAMDQNEVRFEHAAMFEGTAINGAGFAVPGSRLPSLGVVVLSQRSGDIQRTNELNDDLGTFHDAETAYMLTASKALSPRMALGMNLKLVQQTVEDFSANGFGVDVGATYEATSSLKIGASVVNIGGPNHTLRAEQEKYPMGMRAGFATFLFQGRAMVAVDVDHASGAGTRFHAGGEYWIQPAIGLRMGYDNDAAAGGFSYRFAPQYQVDYAASDGALGLEHHVGLSYRFSGFFASSEATPAVFSPTGETAVTRFDLNSRTKSEPREWSLDVRNKSDEVVRRFGGRPAPVAHRVGRQGRDRHAAGGRPVSLPARRHRCRRSHRDRKRADGRDHH